MHVLYAYTNNKQYTSKEGKTRNMLVCYSKNTVSYDHIKLLRGHACYALVPKKAFIQNYIMPALYNATIYYIIAQCAGTRIVLKKYVIFLFANKIVFDLGCIKSHSLYP